MKRTTGLKRAGFARAIIPRIHVCVPAVPIPADISARIRYTGAANSEPVPKTEPLRHAGYLRIVAKLACACCGIAGRSQAAHANEHKGMALKSDDRTAFPMCADEPFRQGCHSKLDQGALYPRDERRLFERLAGQRTRAAIRAIGLWPVDLPAWPGDEVMAA